MSSPYAEGGPLPPVDREKLAAHERRIAEWLAETRAPAETPGEAERRMATIEDEIDKRIR